MIAPLFASLAAVGPAPAGGDRAALADPPAGESPRVIPRIRGEVPPECRRYATGEAPDAAVAWDQLLSLAGCLQDTSVDPITDAAQLQAAVEKQYDALAPSMVLYLAAIEHGPRTVQLRAAYAIGLAHVALVTRLRSSVAAPADRADAAAWARHRSLHVELEPLLARALRTAWVAFGVVDLVATRDPDLARDPVARSEVVSARAMLRVLGEASERPAPRTADAIAI